MIEIDFTGSNALMNNQGLELDNLAFQVIVKNENIQSLTKKFSIIYDQVQLYGDETVLFYFNSEEDAEFNNYIKSSFSNPSIHLKGYFINHSIEIQRHYLEIINKEITSNEKILKNLRNC